MHLCGHLASINLHRMNKVMHILSTGLLMYIFPRNLCCHPYVKSWLISEVSVYVWDSFFFFLCLAYKIIGKHQHQCFSKHNVDCLRKPGFSVIMWPNRMKSDTLQTQFVSDFLGLNDLLHDSALIENKQTEECLFCCLIDIFIIYL